MSAGVNVKNEYINNNLLFMGVDTILELGGAELEVGRKMCACLRAQIFDHTHQYVNTPTYSAYITAII